MYREYSSLLRTESATNRHVDNPILLCTDHRFVSHTQVSLLDLISSFALPLNPTAARTLYVSF